MSFKKDYTITTISNNLSQRMSSSVSGAHSFQQSSPGILSLRGTGTPYTMVASPEEADAGTAQTPVFPLGRQNNPCRILDMGDWTTSPGGTALSTVPEPYNAYVGNGDYALSLTGSGDTVKGQSYVSCSNDGDIAALTSSVTFAAWARFKPNVTTNTWNIIITNTRDDESGWMLGKAGDTSVQSTYPSNRISMRCSNGGNQLYAYTDDAASVGVNASEDWVHVVGVIRTNGSYMYPQLYINGVVQTPAGMNTSLIAKLDSTSYQYGCKIGKFFYEDDEAQYAASASFCDVCIWNVELSAADVTLLYNSGVRSDPTDISASNLILDFKFNEGPLRSKVYDSSTAGYSHTGTLYNTNLGECQTIIS